jgi:hypothetical protein
MRGEPRISHALTPLVRRPAAVTVIVAVLASTVLTHINVYFYLSTKYRKGPKMNINIDLGVCY